MPYGTPFLAKSIVVLCVFRKEEWIKMKIIILGSGTGLPLVDRASPAFVLLLEKRLALFDMGPGTLRQLSRAGIPYNRIGNIFITHFHPDHTADLVHFLFATRHPPDLAKRRPFTITGPQGFRDFHKGLERAYGNWLDIPPEIMEIKELAAARKDRIGYEGFDIISQPVKHSDPSIAYRVEHPSGKSLVYSGDTGFCPEIIDLAKGTDLLVLECALPDNEKIEGHLTPSLAGKIATQAGVTRLILCHFYPEVLETDIAAKCRKTFDGELILGRDLLHVRV
jgi:ribonuclease BN (tRNA processing enzyme)